MLRSLDSTKCQAKKQVQQLGVNSAISQSILLRHAVLIRENRSDTHTQAQYMRSSVIDVTLSRKKRRSYVVSVDMRRTKVGNFSVSEKVNGARSNSEFYEDFDSRIECVTIIFRTYVVWMVFFQHWQQRCVAAIQKIFRSMPCTRHRCDYFVFANFKNNKNKSMTRLMCVYVTDTETNI